MTSDVYAANLDILAAEAKGAQFGTVANIEQTNINAARSRADFGQNLFNLGIAGLQSTSNITKATKTIGSSIG